VRAIGDRLKTRADAERYGVFALRDALEVDPEAWAELREKPEVGPRLAELGRRLAADPEFDLASLERETRQLAQELGIKAGDLMGATRVALTGRKVAPGLFEVMALLGRERTVARLRAAAERWAEESPHARV
jgi:glutamyl-tRNA synthetase